MEASMEPSSTSMEPFINPHGKKYTSTKNVGFTSMEVLKASIKSAPMVYPSAAPCSHLTPFDPAVGPSYLAPCSHQHDAEA